MKTNKIIIGAIVAFMVLGGVATACTPKTPLELNLDSQSAKSDKDCTGLETVGRCADKCPNITDILLGFEPQHHTAICQEVKFVCPDNTIPVDEPNHVCKPQPTGCPYADGIDINNPKCVPPPVEGK